MTEPLAPPRPKNPLHRTPPANVPPTARSRKAHIFTRAAAEGRFMLQRCGGCGTYLYPAHDVCSSCLSADLPVVEAPDGGVILSFTSVRVPVDPYFRDRAPWKIALVGLDCGPKVIAHMHGDCQMGERVRLSFQLDRSGSAAAFALPLEKTAHMTDDRQWREMTADPRYRRILVTNGRGFAAREMVQSLFSAGAKSVYVGMPESWKPWKDEAAIRESGAKIVPLDASDEKSVRTLADDIGGKIDILINTQEHIRAGGLLDRSGTGTFRDEIAQSYLGFVNLAQSFAPAMRARGSDGTNSAVAWINVLSVYGLANWPAYGGYSASQAALLSLSHCLRAELRPGGIKVMNLFTGPTDSEWFGQLPPPKLPAAAVARALVKALMTGVEDVFVGDIAQDVRARLDANPKAVERELGD